MSLLASKTFDLGHGKAGHTAFGQGLTNLFELERFDDSGNHFHACSPGKCKKSNARSDKRHALNLLVTG